MQGGAGVLRWALLLALASAGAEMADRKLGYISARREFEGFAVVFQVHLLRFPTVYNLAMDDVMDIPVNLRVENSTFADARVPTTFPRVTLFINGKPIGRMDTELYTWNNDWRGWESPGSFSIPMEATGMGPGWWKFGMAVDAPDLSGLALPSVDAHCAADCKGGSGAGQAGGVHLMVPWDVRIVKTDAAAPHVAAATAAATAPHRRSAAPLGRWAPGLFPLREGGQGVVNESMSRVAWDTVGARVARMCQGGEGGAAQGGERSGGLAFVMDALSPDSIVHLAAGSVPELDCEMRACHFGVVLELEADAALGTAGLFLQGVELHTHNCPRAADADDALFDAARAVEDTMWDWSADFPRVGETQVRAQGGVGLLLIDAHALGYHAVRAILERWSRPLLPLLHDRAGIVVRSSGACSAGERALRDFVRAEGGEWAVYRNLTGAGDDVVCDANREAVDDAGVGSMTLLLRDREATALAKDRQDPTGARCWGCAAQEMRTPGEKWDVPGVYLTIGGARDEAMQAKVAALGPKARLARYQGRDGRREALCQRLGGGKRSQAGTVCCNLSHWLAIHALFQAHPEQELFVVIEDDVVFDLVPYWPGALSSLLALATEAHPGWQVMNLAASSWFHAAQWLHRDYLNTYGFARGAQRYWGARFYAVRRSLELEEWAAGVARCAEDEAWSHSTACATKLRTGADHSLYAFVSDALATALPLLTIDRVRSVRGGDGPDPHAEEARHWRWARLQAEAWAYVAFLHQNAATSG